MELTKQNSKRIINNVAHKLISPILFLIAFIAAVLCFTVLLGCSRDEGSVDIFITAKVSTSSFEELNTCDINSCCLATEFDFKITYEASPGIEISKIIFDIKWPDGDLNSSEEITLTDNGTNVTYDWCYKFGISEWAEITHRLVTKQGITSNSSMVRLNKPEGAN